MEPLPRLRAGGIPYVPSSALEAISNRSPHVQNRLSSCAAESPPPPRATIAGSGTLLLRCISSRRSPKNGIAEPRAHLGREGPGIACEIASPCSYSRSVNHLHSSTRSRRMDPTTATGPPKLGTDLGRSGFDTRTSGSVAFWSTRAPPTTVNVHFFCECLMNAAWRS